MGDYFPCHKHTAKIKQEVCLLLKLMVYIIFNNCILQCNFTSLRIHSFPLVFTFISIHLNASL